MASPAEKALRFSAVLSDAGAEWSQKVADAMTEECKRQGPRERREWEENPYKPSDVLDEALSLGLMFLSIRYCGAHPQDLDYGGGAGATEHRASRVLGANG